MTLSHGSVSKLTIMDVSPLDRGDFTCIASNAYGQDRATIQLIVQGNLIHDTANFCYYPVFKLNLFLSVTDMCYSNWLQAGRSGD